MKIIGKASGFILMQNPKGFYTLTMSREQYAALCATVDLFHAEMLATNNSELTQSEDYRNFVDAWTELNQNISNKNKETGNSVSQ